jgi:hypothetical protein
VDTQVDFFLFHKILRNFRNKNFVKLSEISQINVAKFCRQSFHVFFRFDLKRDPYLVHKVDLIFKIENPSVYQIPMVSQIFSYEKYG